MRWEMDIAEEGSGIVGEPMTLAAIALEGVGHAA